MTPARVLFFFFCCCSLYPIWQHKPKWFFFFSWKRQSSVFGASVANKCPYVTILLKKCGKGFSFCVGITCACIRVQLAFVVLQHVCSSSLYYLNYLEKSEVRMAADTSSCVVVMGIEYLELLRVLAGWDFSSRFYAAVGGNQCVVSLTYSSRLLEGPCVFRGVSWCLTFLGESILQFPSGLFRHLFFFWLSSIATPTHLSFSCGVKEKKCTV